ncbi:MAG: translation initiation factor IF-2 [Ruminococcus sp.]|jgi:translation initiation factor IF-2
MPKIRVHEIAREIGKTNKEVITFLKDHGIEVKSHMSSLKEAEEKLLRDTFDKEKEIKNEKKEETRSEGKPKKKSNIIQVFRPQNATTPEGKNYGKTRRSDSRPGGGQKSSAQGGKTSQRPPRQGQGGAAAKPAQNHTPAKQSQGAGTGKPASGAGKPAAHGRQMQAAESTGRPAGNQNQRPPRSEGTRRFQNDRDKDRDRDGRDFRKGSQDNRRSGGRKSQADAVDTSMMQKPSRDLRKEKEKEKEKEKVKEKEKFSGERQKGGRRPNQGFRQQSRLPKALQKPVHQHKEEKKAEVKEIVLPEKMTIRELAEKMKMQPAVIVKKLFMEGTMVTVNHEIDFEKAQEIALDYDIIAEPEEKVDVIEELLKEEEEDASTLVPRPPVVCVMGHVDHGKTSLLDAIRNTHVTDREAGGITQHIGAYMVNVNGQKITFLDTPGHEAFTAMRMRGANATDIAILVVAADDGVMPQTIEAINHAKAAGVEIIVAINKIDKPSANVERVKQELSEYELIPEDWGGSTIFVPVSAHTQEGIDELLEMILLTAEVSELKANPKRRARGLVIEAKLDKGKGPVATILVQKGTLHVGDFIAAGACSGKVRAMMDDKGRRVKEAGPSTPVEILGLSDVPNAGEVLVATENDKEAKNFAATFVSENRNRLLEETKSKMSLDDLFNQIQEGNLKELGIVVKADVQGSVEAVKQSLTKLSNDEVVVKIVHGGVGAINESDVTLASASNAIIIGFNVRPDATAKAIAEQEGVDIRLYKVIYQAIEDVEAAMKGLLDPVFEEKVIGHAEVRQIFKASGVGNIAGSYVMDGVFQRGCKVRISREGKQLFDGALASLKRFKDDVKEVKAGYECGLVFEGFNDIQELDQVEAYIMVEVPR